MGFGESLTEIRKSKGISRKDLAEQLDIPYTTLRNYETGQREPGHKLLIKIATLLSVSVDQLVGYQVKTKIVPPYSEEAMNLAGDYDSLDGHGKRVVRLVTDEEKARCETDRQAKAAALRESREQMEAAQEPQHSVIQLRFSVPGYSMPMSAGTGQEAAQEYPENYTLVKEPPRGTSFIACVSGNSMEPTYRDGDLLFIHACEEVAEGQIGVFFMDSQQWVKELGDGILISHNKEYNPIPMREDIRCQGLVLGVCDWSYFA